jgi:arginyl-tRNA synthetase
VDHAGWLPDTVTATHVPYGTVLGPDGRPFKTRAGGTVRLTDLLDEAVARARTVVAEKNPSLDPASLDRIAEQTGIGAVKYADLSTSRLKDHAFDLGRMVSFTAFCEECPVLRAEEPLRANRIALCRRTADTLRQGLELLGIAAPEKM